MSMLDNLAVVLVRPKYPENVGSAARACLNMGVEELVLVDPQGYDIERAAPLATVHARHILETAAIYETLAEALAPFSVVYATTARLGGWRKGVSTPDKAGPEIARELSRGGQVAVVFGPEDKGLENDETSLCGRLLTIPTAREGTSLNLAQAVMVILYESFKANLREVYSPAGPPPSRPITHAEHETLMESMKDSLLAIDYLRKDNPDYWMLPVRRFFNRFTIKRNEFNLLMGVCRQVKWIATRTKNED